MRDLLIVCSVGVVATVAGCSGSNVDGSGEPMGAESAALDANEGDVDMAWSHVSRINARVQSTSCKEHRHASLEVATFNAALAPGYAPYVTERKPKVIQALVRQAKELDALCVQEFWLDTDFDELRSAVAGRLPRALRPAARPGTGTCTIDELTTLGQCFAVNCPSATGTDQIGCAQAYCANEVASLSGGCLGCIWNNIGGDFSVCLGEGGAGDPAIYNGSFDVGLLTRLPIIASEVNKELDSYFVRMAVVYAKLEGSHGKPIHAFCTHLGSPLGIVPYAGKYASWQDEHLAQVQQLRAYIDEKVPAGERVVVMGDMNTGPDYRGLHGDWPENYAALVGSDLVDPYLRQPNVDCTWCPDNVFVDDGTPRKLVDHILIRGLPPTHVQVTRVFDHPVMMEMGSDSFRTNLSDHYGLRATIHP